MKREIYSFFWSLLFLLFLKFSSDFFNFTIQIFLFYFFIPFLVMKSIALKGKEMWLSLTSKKFLILVILIYILLIPVIFFSSKLKEFQVFYPLWKSAKLNIPNFIFYEICVLIQIFSTEFFFRNFFIFPFRRFGIISILPQTIPYFLLHFAKPFPEFLASLIAGILFGYLAYKSKSILPSFILHFLIALTLDVFIIFL